MSARQPATPNPLLCAIVLLRWSHALDTQSGSPECPPRRWAQAQQGAAAKPNTPQYTYAVAAPRLPGWKAVRSAEKYVEYMLYDNYADPYQQVNLAGRAPYRDVAAQLRKRLLARMQESGDAPATIEPCWFPYP